MPELREDQLRHREADRGLRARQREDRASPGSARARPAQHRRGADLLVAEHPEQLAEAVEPFLEQAGNRLVRAVARRDAGPARRDDHAGVAARKLLVQDAPDRRRIVADDRVADDLVPPAVASSAIARPLVSVSAVRVSLIVSVKHRTDAGAVAR